MIIFDGHEINQIRIRREVLITGNDNELQNLWHVEGSHSKYVLASWYLLKKFETEQKAVQFKREIELLIKEEERKV